MTNIELKSPLPIILRSAQKTKPYIGVLIFLIFAGVYGYMIFKINSLAAPQVDENAVLTETKSLPVPKIDDAAAKQLQTLKDNSVNVQTLFEQGRTNPFQE